MSRWFPERLSCGVTFYAGEKDKTVNVSFSNPNFLIPRLMRRMESVLSLGYIFLVYSI